MSHYPNFTNKGTDSERLVSFPKPTVLSGVMGAYLLKPHSRLIGVGLRAKTRTGERRGAISGWLCGRGSLKDHVEMHRAKCCQHHTSVLFHKRLTGVCHPAHLEWFGFSGKTTELDQIERCILSSLVRQPLSRRPVVSRALPCDIINLFIFGCMSVMWTQPSFLKRSMLRIHRY